MTAYWKQTLVNLGVLLMAPLATLFGGDVPGAESFRDPTLPLERRVEDLLSRLTLEEKAILLNHRGSTVKRFGIRSDQWNQCLNGVKWGGRSTTLFPSCIGMAATWNTGLVQEVATVLSDEARAIYNRWHLDPEASGEHKGLIYRAPVINIERNPYWGRNHEAWGEDPFLTGRMGVAYVRGLQGDDPHYLKIAATLKHFAVNNVETDRKKLDCIMPERWLREYWLPHFRDTVVEGKACSLMASYNAINGTPNNRNGWLLTDLLKNEWHHDGFVVSDLGGVDTMIKGHSKGKMNYADAVAQSVMAGCDFSDKEYEHYIPEAVRAGKLTEARLNDAVSRVLRVRFRLGEFDLFDAVPYSKIPVDVICSAKHRAVARKAAQESIVLLQNRDKLLPLDKSKLHRVAVLGPYANRVVLNNYNGTPDKCISALQGIKDHVGNTVEILQEETSTKNQEEQSKSYIVKLPDQTQVEKETELARKADAVILCVGTDTRIEAESKDRKSLGLPSEQEELVKRVLAVNPRTIVVQMSAGPLTVPWLKEHAPAMLQAWWGGEEAGHALADVLFGDVNPAGRLPHTVYASEAQVPPQDEYDISKGFTYMFVKGSPLFSFGHGLSYTTFAYSDIAASENPLAVTVTVKNTGTRAGDEVAQLYLVPPTVTAPRPRLMLRGFQRVSLQPGESKHISFTVPDEKLAFWNTETKRLDVAHGEWGVQVGSSSSDIRLQTQFTK
ncbi:MAG: glycoside hydrolase family 3 C-terminal domain-containing protein [bacterium]